MSIYLYVHYSSRTFQKSAYFTICQMSYITLDHDWAYDTHAYIAHSFDCSGFIYHDTVELLRTLGALHTHIALASWVHGVCTKYNGLPCLSPAWFG